MAKIKIPLIIYISAIFYFVFSEGTYFLVKNHLEYGEFYIDKYQKSVQYFILFFLTHE